MTVENGSARFHRRSNAALSPPTAKKRPKLLPVLLSGCLFFLILSACLLAVLVLIGRHLYDTRNNDTAVGETIKKDDSTIQPKKMLLLRLPNDIMPIHYDVTLAPNLITGVFNGNVNISINLMRANRYLVLHSRNLNISSANLFYFNESKVIDVEYAKENADYYSSEMIFIAPRADAELLPGMYYLNIKFLGTFLNKSVGIHGSRYKAENSEWRTIVSSKFEPTYARQAFPCFDEPNMKAKFTVHLVKPKNDSYIALSNMPEVSQEVVENGVMVNFQESVKMSTYLTCFIVCDFKYSQNTIKTPGYPDVPLRVYATPAQLEKTKLAAEIAVGVIQYFIEYFSIPYPLPKLDLIAIPDFVSGAMEHWGLVTFRETTLLFDEKINSAENKQRVATVISHELAHSWFGNLVTMDWWNDLWLNEGFASYIQYKGLTTIYPDWLMLDQFIIDSLHPALRIDSTPASHPIVQTVNSSDQITELFDTITYNKGASILRMLEGAVGETVFQEGVTNYLKAHQYGNAVTQNLLDQLQKLVGDKLDIADFMKTWTIQMGYPILTVTEDGDNFVLVQQRFLQDPDNPGNQTSPYEYKWTVPVTYTTDVNPATELVWFDHTKSLINIPKPKGAKWIKFNDRQVGYYRVNYELKQWQLLAENIKHMSVADRAHLLEESFSIAESGQLDYSVPLNLTKYMKEELNYVSWSAIAHKIIKLGKYLQDSLQYGKFQDYVVGILNPAYNKLTWNETSDDGHLERRLRVTIMSLAGAVNHADAIKEASKLFKNWLNDPVKYGLSQNLRSTVMKYGMQQSGKNEWEKLLALYKTEIDANDKMNMLRGLAAVNVPWLLRRLIELGKNDEVIRRQDYFIMLQLVSNNPIGTSIVWDYVREHWKELVDRFTLNDRSLGTLMPHITSSFSTSTKLKEMERFFEEYPEAGAGKLAREQALSNVRNNIKWMAKNKKIVEDWIQNNTS